MVLAVVTTETVIWNTVAVVSAPLLPGAVLRLPAARAIALPGNLLLMRLSWTPLLSLLILLHSGLLLPSRGVVLALLLLLSLLILLPLGNLLLVFI